MQLGSIDVDTAFTEYPVFSSCPSGANTVLCDFNGVFVSSCALNSAPSIINDVEPYLKYDAAVSVVFDTGINIHFLRGLAELQCHRPAVYIGGGCKKNAVLSAAGELVEVYNTGPAPLCPKNAITVIPPLVKPNVPPTILSSSSDGCIPVYPLCTVERYRFQSELNSMIRIVRTIADCEHSIANSTTTTSENYVAGLSANIFEALIGNSLWTAMIRSVGNHTGATDNDDIMRHMLRIFREHWYPYLHVISNSSEVSRDDYTFATNTEMIESLFQYIAERQDGTDLGAPVLGLETVNQPNAENAHVCAFKQLWSNRFNVYRLFPALAGRLRTFEAIDCGYIQSSGSESGIIAPGGRMLIILPH